MANLDERLARAAAQGPGAATGQRRDQRADSIKILQVAGPPVVRSSLAKAGSSPKNPGHPLSSAAVAGPAASGDKPPGAHARAHGQRPRVVDRRARLVVRCACELLGVEECTVSGDLHLAMSVVEFENELRDRFALTHPELVHRTDSTTERSRLDRSRLPHLPRVLLRRGAPPSDR